MPISWNIRQPITLDHKGNRSPGLHLSNVLDEISRHYRTMKREWLDAPKLDELFKTIPSNEWQGNPNIIRALAGMAWEEKLITMLQSPYRVWHPPELTLNGVIGSMDGKELDCDTGRYIVHEIKYTYRSSRVPVTEVKRWMWQTAGYLKMLSESVGEQCTDAILHPLHVTGTGKTIDPVYAPQAVRFEWEEIETVWGEVMRFKDQAVPEQ